MRNKNDPLLAIFVQYLLVKFTGPPRGILSDNFSIKVEMEELTARVRRYDEQWLTTPGDLQEGAGGQRSTVLRLLDEGN